MTVYVCHDSTNRIVVTDDRDGLPPDARSFFTQEWNHAETAFEYWDYLCGQRLESGKISAYDVQIGELESHNPA